MAAADAGGRTAAKAAVLNVDQRAAVVAPGHVLVSACPGSGKTKTLEERIHHLLETQPRARIAGVSFTRDSADSLKSRVLARSPGAGQRVHIATFHSFCTKQLQAAGRRMKVIGEGRCRGFMRDAFHASDASKQDPKMKFEELEQVVNSWKAQLNPLLPSDRSDVRLQMYEYYQNALASVGGCDFQDLVLQAVRGLVSGDIKPLDVQYLLVDEFQDADPLQLAWVQAHVDKGVLATVVGDDDQSIYSFRFALGYAGMEQFRSVNRATHISLDTSYRCAAEILRPAARLIAHNGARVSKTLRTENPAMGLVRVYPAVDARDEAWRICEEIERSFAEDGATPGDWAVLARTNAQLDALETAAQGRFPYVRPGGNTLWQSAGPQLLLEFLRSAAGDDLVGVDTLLQKCGVGEGARASLNALHASKARAMSAFVAAGPRVSAGDKETVAKVRDLCARCISLLDSGDDADVNKAILGAAHFIDRNAVKLFQKVRTEAERQSDSERMLVASQILQRLRGSIGMRIRVLEHQKADPEHSVRMLTLHSSKGLEFPRVWLMGCVQGTLPDKRGEVDEERRLAYVGMTRAMQVLVLSFTAMGSRDGVVTPHQPSEFLEQAGLNDAAFQLDAGGAKLPVPGRAASRTPTEGRQPLPALF